MENEIKSISMQDLWRVVTDWDHEDDSSSMVTSASSEFPLTTVRGNKLPSSEAFFYNRSTAFPFKPAIS